MVDLQQKDILHENKMSYAKNFFSRDFSGKVKKEMQVIGRTGKYSRGATCFIHLIPDEDEYNINGEKYFRNLLTPFIESINAKVSERTLKYEEVTFKLPKGSIVEGLKHQNRCPTFSRKMTALSYSTLFITKELKIILILINSSKTFLIL